MTLQYTSTVYKLLQLGYHSHICSQYSLIKELSGDSKTQGLLLKNYIKLAPS